MGTQGASVHVNGHAPEANPALERVRVRRDRMREAMSRLEHVGPPAPDDPERWRDELRGAVEALAVVLEDHVTETESPDGFFDQLITETTGRLTTAVERLRVDHEQLTAMVEQLSGRIRDERPEALHASVQGLLERLAEHRSAGADLLWEAYGVDLGTGD